MNTDRCPDDQALLTYDRGGLSEDRRAWVDSHLQGDCSCIKRLCDLTLAPLEKWVNQAQPIPLPIGGYEYALEKDGSLKPLGSGGQGEVYLARRTDPPAALVAIKFLKLHGGASTPYQRLTFAKEVQAVVGLDHPNIVKVFDIGPSGDRLYYIMEYVAGRNLLDFQTADDKLTRPFPGEPDREWGRSVARSLCEVAGAVAHAHECGFLHRDLKPGNILVETGGESGGPPTMKLTDFGLAIRFDSRPNEESENQTRGTPEYAAPEQLFWKHATGLSPAVDVYGLGAVLYFMLTGVPPFGRSPDGRKLDQHELRFAILREPPMPPSVWNPEVPRQLERVCLKCLRKEPADRYENVAELAEDLARFRDGKPVRARRRTWGERAGRWVRRNRKAAAVMLLLAVSLVVAVGAGGLAVRYSFRAEANAAEARELAYAKLRDAAENALSRGQLGTAEELFDQAIAAAPPEDRPELEVRRLRCLFAFGRWDRLDAELNRLDGTELPPELRAEVLLHRGDVELRQAPDEHQRRGEELMAEALAIPEGLRPVDAAYARGVLALGSTQAIEYFREAVEADRFHLRANAALLVELVLTGQFEEAESRVRFFRAVYPEEPLGPMTLALIATLRENPRRDEYVEVTAALMDDPKRARGMRELFGYFDLSIEMNRQLHGPVKGGEWYRKLMANTALASLATLALDPDMVTRLIRDDRVMPRADSLPPVIGVGLPVIRRPVRMLEELIEAHDLIGRDEADAAIEILERLEREYPESLILEIHAVARLTRSYQLLRQGDFAGGCEESMRAYRLCQRAAEAPTMIPFGPYRHNADWLCVMIGATWDFTRTYNTALAATAGLSMNLGGPLSGVTVMGASLEAAGKVPTGDTHVHLQRVLSRSRGHDEAREQLFWKLMPILRPAVARMILRDWAEDLPGDALPVKKLAELEYSHRDYEEAQYWAERALKLVPKDRDMRRIYESSVRRSARTVARE